jgi:hypothetical protein
MFARMGNKKGFISTLLIITALIMLLSMAIMPNIWKAGKFIGSKLVFFPKKEGMIITKDSLGNLDTVKIPHKKEKKGLIITKDSLGKPDTIYLNKEPTQKKRKKKK